MSINVVKGEEKINYKIGAGSIVKSRSGCAVLNSESLFMILDDINNNVLIANKNSIAEMIAFKLVNNVDIVLR